MSVFVRILNEWKLAAHVHELYKSEFELIISCWLVLNLLISSILSIMQSLQLAEFVDFMHLILSPCHKILGDIRVFIFALTWLLEVQSLQIAATCLDIAVLLNVALRFLI